MDVDDLIQRAEEERQAGLNAEAVETLDSAVSVAEATDDHSALASALNNLGNLYEALDRDGDAVAALTRAVEVADARGLPELACTALGNLGSHYRLMRQFGKAEAAYRDVLKRFEVMENDHGRVSALGYLGMLEEARGNVPEARDYWRQGLEVARSIAMPDLRYFETALRRTAPPQDG